MRQPWHCQPAQGTGKTTWKSSFGGSQTPPEQFPHKPRLGSPQLTLQRRIPCCPLLRGGSAVGRAQMLSLVLKELQLGVEGKEQRESAWNGLRGSQKVPPPIFMCFALCFGAWSSILHHSPGPQALVHSSPAKNTPKNPVNFSSFSPQTPSVLQCHISWVSSCSRTICMDRSGGFRLPPARGRWVALPSLPSAPGACRDLLWWLEMV